MMLNTLQIETYKANGFLILKNLFSLEELIAFKKGLTRFENLKTEPNVICEKNESIRSIFVMMVLKTLI